MRLTIPYPPSTNSLYATVRGRRVKTAKAREYAEQAASIARRSGSPQFDGPVSVKLSVYRPAKRGDLDNTLKSLLDSLTGIVWKDDSQVSEIHARRFEDKVNPRVEIEVEAI